MTWASRSENRFGAEALPSDTVPLSLSMKHRTLWSRP
jgi:hypothetical protein